MSAIALQIDITGNALAAAEALVRLPQSVDMRLAMGRQAARTLKAHFRSLNDQRHKSTVTRKGTYLEMAEAVQAPRAVADGVVISINHRALAQRYYGGPIAAGKGVSSATGQATKFLAIPVAPEALGRRPSSFANLRLIPGKGGKKSILAAVGGQGVLKGARPSRGDRKKGAATFLERLTVMYVLIPRVKQDPDHSVLPPPGVLEAAAIDGGRQWLHAQMGRS